MHAYSESAGIEERMKIDNTRNNGESPYKANGSSSPCDDFIFLKVKNSFFHVGSI